MMHFLVMWRFLFGAPILDVFGGGGAVGEEQIRLDTFKKAHLLSQCSPQLDSESLKRIQA